MRIFLAGATGVVGRPGRSEPWDETVAPYEDTPGDLGVAIAPLLAGFVLRYGAFYGPGTVFA